MTIYESLVMENVYKLKLIKRLLHDLTVPDKYDSLIEIVKRGIDKIETEIEATVEIDYGLSTATETTDSLQQENKTLESSF